MQMRVRFLDSAKGMAIVCVVIFHALYDLSLQDCCFNYGCNLQAWWWEMLAFPVIGTFMLSAGILEELSYARAPHNFWKRTARRTLVLAFWAALISLVTWLFWREEWVVFGILHFFAVAGILGGFLVGRPRVVAFISLLVFIGSWWVTGIFTTRMTWVWLGISPDNFSSLDYFPLMPWFGIYGSGIVVGTFFLKYPKKVAEYDAWLAQKLPAHSFFEYLGKRTLLIYLLHQPILLALIYFFSRI